MQNGKILIRFYKVENIQSIMHVTGKQIAGKKLQIMVQVYQTFLKIWSTILFFKFFNIHFSNPI